ncbi:triple functional domain protein [Bactrocera dorsalis]|uniref:Triple functional domain protein n=1 Tax=Bactrocera dorsalis TaxID=27457 RepID=A0A6I9VBT7_BACDO|nr:triple functional domain protein [Bactrocera dorsalis]XP_011206927.2 triple functional domain protein [Bactrocera dorsalis]XP_011206928.2 triple functional domain protein [Bactrocera dorsalis]XP_029407139.2 triple functional domain protein [Bactrocera dorsalis]XP_049308280.1 triple functional domain protein [Bactrocera dorsalis]
MADECAIDSPRPFRRERNLSNRNFAKRRSNRRISVESHSSVESFNLSAAESVNNASSVSSVHEQSSSASGNDSHNHSTSTSSGSSGSHSFSVASSQLDYSYSVQSDTESAFLRASTRRMVPPPLPITGPPFDNDAPTVTTTNDDETQPQTPDPALLGVRQKVDRFETLTAEQRILFKTGRHQLRQQHQQYSAQIGAVKTTGVGGISAAAPGLWRVFPPATRRSTPETDSSVASRQSALSSFHTSIDEERSVDDVDEISDYAEDAHADAVLEAEYAVPEEAHELREDVVPSPEPGADAEQLVTAGVVELNLDDFGKVEKVRRAVSDDYARTMPKARSKKLSAEVECGEKSASKDFPRNYRSVPRPKTEIIGTKNHAVVNKSKSLYQPNDELDDEAEAELRDKSSQHIKPILEELIKTEETYVENLRIGLENYGNIFARKDLPLGLRGKKYVLLGNIAQIYEFHAEEFLPMLLAYRRDLKRLFDEFQHYIDQNSFYCYVIFTMNKQRSLKLCDTYKNYFKRIQNELDDKLGINSFLVQPIQRMARYPLLLQQFITTLFKHRDFEIKPLLESCCRLEKKMRTLLTTTNESEVINDIVECNEFNVFHQGKFRKVSDFSIIDHTLRRTYRGKVFIFDKCIIYTEIKGKHLIFHGRYPCEHIGIVAKTKHFTLFYERRKQQECDFQAEPPVVEAWLELIREMISSFVMEERQKLQDRYAREGEQQYRKPVSLTLFRDSNRFSSDSGIGNIWVLPKPEAESEASSNRTTWYAVN